MGLAADMKKEGVIFMAFKKRPEIVEAWPYTTPFSQIDLETLPDWIREGFNTNQIGYNDYFDRIYILKPGCALERIYPNLGDYILQDKLTREISFCPKHLFYLMYEPIKEDTGQ